MKKTEKEWRKIVQLAHYTRLASTDNPQQLSSEMEKIKGILQKEHGLTQEELEMELQRFKKEVLPQKETLINKKVAEIVSDIVKGLKNLEKGEYLNTIDNREIYYKIQEVLAIDPVIGDKVLQKEEKKANIKHTVYYRSALLCDKCGHTYYFSFDK